MTGSREWQRITTLAGNLAADPELPQARKFGDLVGEARAAMGSSQPSLRPRDSRGMPGGLLRLPAVPTILVPDLHGRIDFLAALLGWRPPLREAQPRSRAGAPSEVELAGKSVAQLLEEGELCLVCLGDAFHTEQGEAQRRWASALREFASGWVRSDAMDEEMSLALSTVRIVLELLGAFPSCFFYLKGNHDNLANEEGGGDHPFRKYAMEGAMVASWFERRYGKDLLAEYRRLELDLPLAVAGPRFAASHGEPRVPLGIEDIVEYRRRAWVVEALIWTANDEAEEGSVSASLATLLGRERPLPRIARGPGPRWFGGHRPVRGAYALRAGGRYVQFHDPSRYNIAFLAPNADPDPDRDVFSLPPA
jgi:hypothetical protein